MAAAVPTGAEGLRLRPDAALRKSGEMFMNRSAIHHRGHEVRAILEGVAAELRRQVMLLCEEPAAVGTSSRWGAKKQTMATNHE